MHRRRWMEAGGLAALVVVLMAAGPGLYAAEGGSSDDRQAPPADLAPAVADRAPAPEAESAGPVPAASSGMGVYKGTVIDRRSGKPVEGATVVFINEETSETRDAVTEADGSYQVELPAGEYVVDIKVGRKTYRSTGTFREEASGKRWVMDFTIGTKLTERDLKIETTPRDIRVLPAEPRPPLQASKKLMEFFIFIGGLAVVGALAN